MNPNYDSSVPFPPKLAQKSMKLHYTEFAGGNDIVYANGYLYLISSAKGGSLRILRCTEGDVQLLSELNGLGNMRQIEISADAAPGRVLVAATARECGMYLIDATDPLNPFICCHYNTVEFATGVTFGGSVIAIGCRSFGVELLDVEDPSCPRHISTIRAGEVQSVFIENGILYTGSWWEKQVNLIDISDAASPRLMSTVSLDGRGDGLFVKDGLLYAAFGQHLRAEPDAPTDTWWGKGNGFAIWDVKDPLHPHKLSVTFLPHRYYCTDCDTWDVTLSGRYAVLSHTFNGIWVYDVSDPTAPTLVNQVAFRIEKPMAEVITMNDRTLNRSPIVFPFDIYRESYAPVLGVAVADGCLYAAAKCVNLVAIQADYFVEEPRPVHGIKSKGERYYLDHPGQTGDGVKILQTSGQTHAVAYLDGLVYAACGLGGIAVYDAELHFLGRQDVSGFAMDIRETNGLLYAALGKAGVAVYRPENGVLKELGRLSVDDRSCAQAVPSETGRFLMVHTGDSYLSVIDVSDPSSMRVVMTERYLPGLIYHRHLSYEGVGGRYYGCYWNNNHTHWYDLSSDKPVQTDYRQMGLNFFIGFTGLQTPYEALIIRDGGYALVDIRDDRDYSTYPTYRVDGVRLTGKPRVKDGILYVSDRVGGGFWVLNIEKIDKPRLLYAGRFSGYPDIACPIPDGAIVPLGHQGLALIRLHNEQRAETSN